jgi:hypothetical protein
MKSHKHQRRHHGDCEVNSLCKFQPNSDARKSRKTEAKPMSSPQVFVALVFVLVAGAAAHSPGKHSAGHHCIHDTIKDRARKHWDDAGVPNRFVLHEEDLTFPGSHTTMAARSLQSYSNIRITIKTDLLADGAYVMQHGYTNILAPLRCRISRLCGCLCVFSGTCRTFVKDLRRIQEYTRTARDCLARLGLPTRFRAPTTWSCAPATQSTTSLWTTS